SGLPPGAAPGRASLHPAPVPGANGRAPTPPSAKTLAAVTTFWTQRPDETPTRLIAVNSATSPAPKTGVREAGQERSRARNSAAATPMAAIAAPFTPTLSIHPTTNAARRPNASRAYTYCPPARGYRVVSSEKHSAPSKAITPPSTQATKVSPGRPRRAATIPCVRKIPEPIVIPTTIASPSPRRSERLRSVMRAGGECAPKTKGAQQAAPLTTLTPGSLPNAVGPPPPPPPLPLPPPPVRPPPPPPPPPHPPLRRRPRQPPPPRHSSRRYGPRELTARPRLPSRPTTSRDHPSCDCRRSCDRRRKHPGRDRARERAGRRRRRDHA